MDYMIGCNYWGSKHGTDMWKYWDEGSVRKDLEELSKYNVKYLRVFPNWREFQPIYALRDWHNKLWEYRFADDCPIDNEFGLDMNVVENFKTFCKIADDIFTVACTEEKMRYNGRNIKVFGRPNYGI